jgi:hypothetical protein|tara:strand:- start:13565 stop:13963 length:399 start_codon:yes stop_codon:yes gene_type:complete
MDKKINPSIRQINNLVSKSFGPFCRGNWKMYSGGNYGSPTTEKIKKPNLIGRIWTLLPFPPLCIPLPSVYIPLISNLFGPIATKGKFTSEDGSSLVVKPKYEKSAERYSELYKEIFGKPVEIRVSENIPYYG